MPSPIDNGLWFIVYSFNILYQSSPAFKGHQSLIKMIAMMQGEFDYADNLSSQIVKEDGGRNLSIQVFNFL